MSVRVKILYECGRCSNRQVREYTSKDGLLEVPTVYCGNCVKSKRLSTLTTTVTEAKLVDETADESTEVCGLPRQPEVPAGGGDTAPVGGKTAGWQLADKADNSNSEPPARK